MNQWLYTAASARASESETLKLAYESGFIWRSFYNQNGNAIACVKQIQPGDEITVGYRVGKNVKLLARFRVGRPEHRSPDLRGGEQGDRLTPVAAIHSKISIECPHLATWMDLGESHEARVRQ